MTDDEWLDAMFVEPGRRLAELPEWARPVVTPERTFAHVRVSEEDDRA